MSGKGRADFYESGSWNAVCYECGRKRKAGELRKHWQGYFVCPEHWEARHPQDFVRGVADVQTPAWTQPMPADQFVLTCTLDGSSAIPGIAMPGCMLPGREFYQEGGALYSYCTMESVLCKAGWAAAGCATVGRVS